MGLIIPTEPYQKQTDNQEGLIHPKLHRIGTHIDVKKGADLQSAGTVTFGNDGWFFDITGTTTITRFEFRQAGEIVFLQFDAALTLTHNATNLILSGAGNITTAAGDVFGFISEGGAVGAGNWRQIFQALAAGSGVGAHTIASHSDTSATGAELNELTDGSETTLHTHALIIGFLTSVTLLGGGGGFTDITTMLNPEVVLALL